MHNAPAVSFPVGNGRVGLAVVTAVWSMAVVVVGVWLLQDRIDRIRLAAATATTVLAVVSVALARRSVGAGMLCWDGRDWNWLRGEMVTSGRLLPALDFQVLLLVRFVPHSGRAIWFWANRSAASTQWDAFRRAVVSAARLD